MVVGNGHLDRSLTPGGQLKLVGILPPYLLVIF